MSPRVLSILLAILVFSAILITSCTGALKIRQTENFGKNWKFHLGEASNAQDPAFDDSAWRVLRLPHDWSVEGEFSDKNPATAGGGALPGGIGWYRKAFSLPESQGGKSVFIDFDGVYRNSEVWINGNYLGKRPYGYSSFRYELTPYLLYGDKMNVLAVKVDNSQQPNSRWYSGSGIYRNVWLVTTDKIFVNHWGTFITTPQVGDASAKVVIKTQIQNASQAEKPIALKTTIYSSDGKKISTVAANAVIPKESIQEISQELTVNNPSLWSVEQPTLYTAVSRIECDGQVCDDYETPFGIRTFTFDREKGFILNGKQVKIKGVCNHHDLGFLGAAINTRALERQLEIMKDMGCNGIRTSHNPPTPELLDLCDRMGFIVMDETFDIWKKKKTDFDYHLDFDQWHKRDTEDMVLRDRNHPSVFIWSIGNEVMEQWDREDSSGVLITRELAGLIRNLDSTRPITANCNDPDPQNPLFKSSALDLLGFSYHQNLFVPFLETYPEGKFIGSETTSALATRGHYDMPSDSIRRWPERWDKPLDKGNADYTCSSYDNCSAPWGSTHEESWKIIKKHDFLSGMYVWTGFDYLGEPTPYPWPARSSYFGIVDLAGFPKDAFYMYQSEWTDKPVLHIFPYWNWNEGQSIDVWVYTNFDQVELFLNDKSLGAKSKVGDELHLAWRVPFFPGTVRAVGTAKDKATLVREVKTAGNATKIALEADRTQIHADGNDLSFITVRVVDNRGTMVPDASNMINFEIQGEGVIAGVDNGCQTSHEPFKANYRKTFNGMALVVVQANEQAGEMVLKATSDGLESASVKISAK
jgi:beta-galactosidase